MFKGLIINLILATLFSQINPTNISLKYSFKSDLNGLVQEIQVGGDNSFPMKRLESKSLGIKTEARSVIIRDGGTGKILFEKNSKEKLPVASLTKLMTAVVFLDLSPDWQKEIEVTSQDEREGGKLYVMRGEKVKVLDLFYTALAGSANNAILALVRATGKSQEEFVNLMNKKAKSLDLKDTHFVEPTGLSPQNISSAQDIAKLASYALRFKEIRDATTTENYSFKSLNGRGHDIKNTDLLLKSFLNDEKSGYRITGGKTGYIEEAGYCLMTRVANKRENEIIVVVLGAEDHFARFQEVKGLAFWTFENYEWN